MHPLPKGPFSLPFKGKGEEHWRSDHLRRRHEEAVERCREIETAMQGLISTFEGTFTVPLAAYLTLHRTGNGLYLRWRMAGTRQSYFSLADSDTGRLFTSQLPSSVLPIVHELERQRLQLNLLHGISHYEARALQRFMDEMKTFKQMRRVS